MESKRQLPPWMLRAAATDKVSNSVSEVKQKGNGLQELPIETCHQDSSVEVLKSLVRKCKTTRSRRKPVKRADDDGDVSNKHGGNLEKKNYAPPKRKRKAKVLNAVEESNISEDELSVDDLISIAKEHINADKIKKVKRSKFAVSESDCLPLSISFKNKTTHKDNTPSGDSISNGNTLEASSSDMVECQPSERGVISSSNTGVLTQDLIELFLGPFVKTCSEVKPNPEPVTNSTKPDYPSSNQTRDGLEGDPIPPVKKKGSVKDRVALLWKTIWNVQCLPHQSDCGCGHHAADNKESIRRCLRPTMNLLLRSSTDHHRLLPWRISKRFMKSLRFPQGKPVESPPSTSAAAPLAHGVHVFQCPDSVGIVAKLSECIASKGGNILGADVFVPEKKRVFYSRRETACCSFIEFMFDPHKWPRKQMDEDFLELSKMFHAMRSVVRVPSLDPKDKIAILASKQILSGDFLRAYGKDIINIHHGLLPSFKGGYPSKQVERVSHRENLQSFVRKSENLEKQCLLKAIKSYCELRVLPYEGKAEQCKKLGGKI
ncbi:hypothetical protein V2J09_011508 [Rumex salicifolius]